VTRIIANWMYRARLWWLWLVCSFRFRWAHRPLCEHFRADVIRVRGVYLCRSCACAYCGILTCGIFLALARPTVTEAGIALACTSIVTLALSSPCCYKKLPRAARDALRWAMGTLIAIVGYLFVCRELIIALPASAVLWIFWRVYFRARRQRRLHACDQCEELAARGVCTGCQIQADGVRRYEEAATRLYLAAGRVPECLSGRSHSL